MLKTIIFILLVILFIVFTIILLINIINLLRAHFNGLDNISIIMRLKRNLFILVVIGILGGGLVFVSQLSATTPAINTTSDNSITKLEEIDLNGRKEWISIRGVDKDKPVILMLAGGPGGSQMAAFRHELSELEKHFVVVNWDQPGSGKSYYAINNNDISVNTYLEDGYVLTKYLCDSFNQDKIYLLGESWGSALGIFMIEQHPELYHAFIGTGQMVDFLETEKIDYELALKLAEESNDTKKVNKLKANGKPPYYGKDVTWKSAEYINYLSSEMMSNLAIHNNGYNTFRDIYSSEYGIIDKINYVRGIIKTFNNVYQQLYEIDLRTDYNELEVPVYFFIGKHDINAPTKLVEEYYDILDAPKKKLIWFEHSGHSPWINERDLFIEEVLKVKEEN